MACRAPEAAGRMPFRVPPRHGVLQGCFEALQPPREHELSWPGGVLVRSRRAERGPAGDPARRMLSMRLPNSGILPRLLLTLAFLLIPFGAFGLETDFRHGIKGRP